MVFDRIREFFSEMSDSPSPETNITCNILVSRNQTIVVIQRGWEGIPESIVLNLTVCLVRILRCLPIGSDL